MTPIQTGDRIPSLKLRTREGDRFLDLDTEQLFGGKTVVLFGLPGAFTPTCSSAHVPRYEELYEAMAAQGVDEVICTSVNDAFVMDAWKEAQGVDKVRFLADGNGTLASALGMLVDKTPLGFGQRSWRYSLLVRDGVVAKTFIEAEVEGDPYEVSDADTMLAHLGGTAPADILLFTKPGCGHCRRARQALDEAGLDYTELPATPGALRALPGPNTTPQVYVDGAHVGGADELIAWIGAQA
jgi:peroxiredoxin/glutaredoxin